MLWRFPNMSILRSLLPNSSQKHFSESYPINPRSKILFMNISDISLHRQGTLRASEMGYQDYTANQWKGIRFIYMWHLFQLIFPPQIHLVLQQYFCLLSEFRIASYHSSHCVIYLNTTKKFGENQILRKLKIRKLSIRTYILSLL